MIGTVISPFFSRLKSLYITNVFNFLKNYTMINEETFNEDEEKDEKPEIISLDTRLVHKMNMRVNSRDDPEAFINEWMISGGEGYSNPEEDYTQEDLDRINSYEPD